MGYEHTQRAPLHWLIHPFGLIAAVSLWEVRGEPAVAGLLACGALAMFVIGFSFMHLTVRDEVDALRIAYGPLPLFGTRVRYADITAVNRGRSKWIDGWGIHYVAGRGWTFNLWGFDCVELELHGKRQLRIGTDDAENLQRFLVSRLAGAERRSDGTLGQRLADAGDR